MDAWQAFSTGAVGFCVGLILVGLIRFPRSPLAQPFFGAAACAALWAAGDVITWTATDLTTEQVGITVLYSGSIFLPPLWWLLAVRWARARGVTLARSADRLCLLGFAWATGMWLVMFTNPWHHRFLIPILGERNVLLPLWWAMAIPNYALIVGVAAMQLWVARRVRSQLARREAALMISASLLVLVANWLYVLWLEPPPIDGTLLVLVASGVLLLAGLRIEEERRVFEESLSRAVETRTTQLDEANGELRLVNQRLRELQEQLLRAKRLGTEQYLAGSIAHSINNPLGALMGRIEMALEAEKGDTPTLQRMLELARHIRQVVEGTLALVRRRSLNLGVEAPAAILEEVRDELSEPATKRGVEIELKSSPGLPDLVVDRSLMVAAFVGIGENAIDAMKEEGGHLWLEAEETATIGFPAVTFRIADSGSGIPANLRARVFEPFFTTKRAGTGLGLAVARGVIQGHAGRIRIDDRPGGGTLVTIELPVRLPGVAPSGRCETGPSA